MLIIIAILFHIGCAVNREFWPTPKWGKMDGEKGTFWVFEWGPGRDERGGSLFSSQSTR